MYEYKIKLDFKVDNCTLCPFRNERTIYEDVRSLDKLSGVVGITRIISYCALKNEQVLMNEVVDSYNSKCPLKGNINYLEDK